MGYFYNDSFSFPEMCRYHISEIALLNDNLKKSKVFLLGQASDIAELKHFPNISHIYFNMLHQHKNTGKNFKKDFTIVLVNFRTVH